VVSISKININIKNQNQCQFLKLKSIAEIKSNFNNQYQKSMSIFKIKINIKFRNQFKIQTLKFKKTG